MADKKIINTIIDVVKIKKRSSILEIGPGTGNLTIDILKPQKNDSYRKDNQLAEIIK